MKILSAALLLAGLVPASVSAGTDGARAAQLPPIDAGAILNQIQNSQDHFPTPPLTTLDMCVFSEFKNNKCYFRCQSGAILTEPAVRPDFSTGEPAGACSTHILRPITRAITQPAATDRNLTSSQLKDLLEDSNPEIRKAAVKSARNYIQNSFANEPVLEIFKNTNERADIRVEAARTLSYASGYSKVQDAFTDLIKYGSEPRVLRVMTYKALYSAAAMSSRFQDFLIDAVKYEKDRDARRAAIWALYASVQNSRPQEILTDLLKYGNEEEATKIEAIKSLYGAVGNYRVKDLLQDLARNSNERKPVRLVAIKALSGATGDSSVQRFIEDMVRNESDPELRVAAIEAASPNMADLREYFHLGYKLENGGYISPIEKE
ncbi:MAG: HEAT repeat domain-containing protein [Elusimicrobiota bacterium]|nr:HEAT repeat domain-containing protein [Elusimicrobiota bacterium]